MRNLSALPLAGFFGAAVFASGCARLDELWNKTPAAPATGDAGVSISVATSEPEAETPDASSAPIEEAVLAIEDAGANEDDASVLADDAATADAGAANVPTITGLAFRTPIVEAPQANARWIGYVRAGGRVPVLTGPVGNDGCLARRDVAGAGWYQVEGGGFMCVGPLAVLSRTIENRPVQRRLPAQPDLDASMPFLYGIGRRSGAVYRWLPSIEDEREVEPERFEARAPAPATAAAVTGDGGVAVADPDAATTAATTVTAPSATAGDGGAAVASADSGVRIEDLEGMSGSPLLRRMLSGMYVSLDREVRASGSGSTYWHTQSGGYVRSGVVSTLRSGPTFQGVRLDANTHLPVGFAISNISQTYQPSGPRMAPLGRVPRLTFFRLASEPPTRVGNEEFYRTVEGFFVRSRQVRVITAHEPPPDLSPGEKWVDVNLDHQSLVAYEGTTPVYVTVGSSGRRNRGSVTENYETIQGSFRIQSKHVATTMDGNSNDGPYSIEDVPWVMYFEQSFALHGAFWHDGFGLMHSHGCVNLAPADARWLFGWTEPRIPSGWHGVYATALAPGTRVYVHYDNQVLGERGGPSHVPTH